MDAQNPELQKQLKEEEEREFFKMLYEQLFYLMKFRTGDEAITIIQKQLNKDVKRKDDPKVIAFVEEQKALIEKKKA